MIPVAMVAKAERPKRPATLAVARWLAAVAALAWSCALCASPAYPLKRAPGERYLVDQNDEPFLWTGDSPWSLIVQLSQPDAQAYLDNRQLKGFNTVLVNLIEHKFATAAPNNWYGQPPFILPGDFSTPNEAYFAHADSVIAYAAARGIQVLLAPIYVGYNCGDEGWCSEMRANGATKMRNWGRFVGQRYAGFSNLVWAIGGDTDPPGDVRALLQEVVAGIRDFDTNHLLTAHCGSGSSARDVWEGEPWLSVNSTYTYGYVHIASRMDYARAPLMPFFLIESAYENEHSSTPQSLRAQAYWSVLSGSMGQNFGNCPVWHLGATPGWCGLTNWLAELDHPGSVGMMHLKHLFTSRPWHTLIPDTNHAVVIAGYGSANGSDYLTAGRARNGQTLIAYLPTQRTITVDMTQISGTNASCWWFNPATGVASNIGQFSTSGTRSFAPASNADWVIVIDNAALHLPAPGAVALTAYQLWKIGYSLPVDAADFSDGDADGVPLLLEYALALDPTSASTNGQPNIELGATPGAFEYGFNRARSELVYEVQVSTNLLSWSSLAINPGTSHSSVKVHYTPDPAGTCGFLRLNVTRP